MAKFGKVEGRCPSQLWWVETLTESILVGLDSKMSQPRKTWVNHRNVYFSRQGLAEEAAKELFYLGKPADEIRVVHGRAE